MEVVVHNAALISSGFLFLHLHWLNKYMEHKGLHAVKETQRTCLHTYISLRILNMKFALFRHWRVFGHVILSSLHWAHIHLSWHLFYRRHQVSAPSWYIILTVLAVMSFPSAEVLLWLHITQCLSFDVLHNRNVYIQGT